MNDNYKGGGRVGEWEVGEFQPLETEVLFHIVMPP